MAPPLNFPNSPGHGDTYAGGPGGGTWTWDGSKWESSTAPSLYLPIAGGTMTGLLTLSGDPTTALGAVTKQYSDTKLALAGGTMTGLLVLSGNATAALNPVSLQQLQAGYMPLSGGTFTGAVSLPTGSTVAGYLPLSGGTLTGGLTGTTASFSGALNVLGTSNITAIGGNVTAGNALQAGGSSGPYWQNNSGTMYTPQALQTGNNMIVTGQNLSLGPNVTSPTMVSDGSIVSWNLPSGNSSYWWHTSAGPGNNVASLTSTGTMTLYGSACRLQFQNDGGVLYDDGNLHLDGNSQIWIGHNVASQILNVQMRYTYFTGDSDPQTDHAYSSGYGSNAWAFCSSYSFVNASGRDKKIDIAVPEASALDQVMALVPKEYRWREDWDADEGKHVEPGVQLHRGFIADEVLAVMGDKFAGYMKTKSGNEMIAYNDLTAVLWQAVRELAAEVTELKSQINGT